MTIENCNLDPINFFPREVCDLIISNLNGTDLINSTLINPNWNEYITSNKDFSNKLKVKLSCTPHVELSDEVVKAMIVGGRQYTHLHVECCAYCLEKTYPFLLTQKFKHVKVSKTSFTHALQALEFFSKIEKSVETIDIKEVMIKYAYFDGKNKGLQFPNLKKFKTRNMQSFLFYEIFNNVKSLEVFSIACHDLNVASLNALTNFVYANVNLKDFEICGRVFRQLFFFDLSEKSSFKLEKLTISEHDYTEEYPFERIYGNVAALIRKQAQTLSEVAIDDWMGSDIMKAIIESPNLKKFSMKAEMLPQLKIEWDSFELPTNVSITFLSIPTNDIAFVKKILRRLPNIEKLICSYVNEEIVTDLSQCFKKLTHLTIEFLNIENFSKYEIFKSLQMLYVKNFISSMLNVPNEWRY